ncbi:hypothetical protein C8046_16015 [Serinibacter arcticus]|uniref:GGDEF domain-containing protein n=1 Tax=Serinibacter arcticus TaxID=1655435 RepID=A0A2U1ZY55_9MICO|nr:GGDEF domain-containing protein [Serinibacter arcticus]PWD51925.1 hypothetical protein C8046_16015 [Serinibacter arcticus]
MNVDLPTVLLLQHLVVGMLTVVYGVDVVRRGFTSVDRYWMIAYLAAGLASLGHLIGTLTAQRDWTDSVADALLVLAAGAAWSGVRVLDGARPRLWMPVLTAVAVAVAGGLGSSVEPRGYLAVVAGWAVATAVATVRGSAIRHIGGAVIAGSLGVGGSALLLHTVVGMSRDGAAAPTDLMLSPETAALIIMVAVVGTGVGTLLLRTGEGGALQVGEALFDPATGVRTPLGLHGRAAALLEDGRAGGRPSTVAVVELVDAVTLLDAYGSRMIESARELVAAVLIDTAPRGSLVGTVEGTECSFVVVLPDHDAEQADPWRATVVAAVRASRVEVVGDGVRLGVSVGLADGDGALLDLVDRAS